MDMIGRIRRLHSRGNKSEREIARLTGLSRNTVAKWLKAPAETAPKYQRKAAVTKLTPFHEALKQALRADARRPVAARRTAKALYAEVKAAGYAGCYTRVKDFIREWRAGEGQSVVARAFVPLTFALGEAFQFDWSEEGQVVGGVYHRMQVAHMKLCASRAFFLVAYPSQGHEMLFDAHTRSFAALGGVPLRGIFDNMKTAVDKVNKGKERVVNERFAAMCAHYLFDPDFCNVASGWEKGVVEKNVQDSRRRIWIEAGKQRFGSFVELNAWLAARCRALWEELRHPEHEQFTIAEMLEHERAALMPMPEPFDGYVERPARVSSTCLVTVARNRYSVPCELAGQMVSARLYPDEVVIVAGDATVCAARRACAAPAGRSGASRTRSARVPAVGGAAQPGDGAGAGPRAQRRPGGRADRRGSGARERAAVRARQRRARPQRAGPVKRRGAAGERGHRAESDDTAAGRYGALRQPADSGRGGRPCVT